MNAEVWFRGELVKLSGKVENCHGQEFAIGEYMTGHREGEIVSVAISLLSVDLQELLKVKGE